MKKLRYRGALPAVSFRLPDGESVVVERNHQVEVPDEVGASLLEQVENWSEVGESKKADKKKDGE